MRLGCAVRKYPTWTVVDSGQLSEVQNVNVTLSGTRLAEASDQWATEQEPLPIYVAPGKRHRGRCITQPSSALTLG
jgi:hypothetical protein